jgi:hypothetical protein
VFLPRLGRSKAFIIAKQFARPVRRTALFSRPFRRTILVLGNALNRMEF